MPALRVVHSFDSYAIGDLITDPGVIASVSASAAAQFVVRVMVEAPPAKAGKAGAQA